MNFAPIKICPAKVAIMGHNGVGHCVSHSGFRQDDSVGFAMLVNLLQQCVPLDLSIKNIWIDRDSIEIELCCSGKGKAYARRGISLAEKELLKKTIGLSSYSPQSLAMQVFGRVYGQGINETCSAFNLAYSKAILDSYKKAWEETIFAEDSVPESAGAFLAGCMSFNGHVISWMLTVNASTGGLGPNEDSEGNIPVGNKGKIMQKMGMDTIPTIILEGRAYVPALSKNLQKSSFWVRWNGKHDNAVVGKALIHALEKENLPFIYSDEVYPRKDLTLEKECHRIGQLLVDIGTKYQESTTSAERVNLAGLLAKLVSEDMGGSIFMSNKIFELTAGGGLFPGLAAVLSIIIPHSEFLRYGQINYYQKEIEQSSSILSNAIQYVIEHYTEALEEINTKKISVSPDEFLMYCSKTF